MKIHDAVILFRPGNVLIVFEAYGIGYMTNLTGVGVINAFGSVILPLILDHFANFFLTLFVSLLLRVLVIILVGTQVLQWTKYIIWAVVLLQFIYFRLIVFIELPQGLFLFFFALVTQNAPKAVLSPLAMAIVNAVACSSAWFATDSCFELGEVYFVDVHRLSDLGSRREWPVRWGPTLLFFRIIDLLLWLLWVKVDGINFQLYPRILQVT